MTTSWPGIAATAVVLAWTLLPLSSSPRWWVRGFEFPRAQLAGIGLLLALLVAHDAGLATLLDQVLVAVILACTGYQLYRIVPYTPLHRPQIAPARACQPDDTLTILVANVLMTNRDADGLLSLVRSHQPDLLLTLESDAWWQERLETVADTFRYRVRQAQDDTYGMHLYSRLELPEHEVRFLVEDNVPSIHATLRLRNGQTVDLRCLHPAPPSPTENETSVERDAELLIVARELDAASGPVIVTGDLNDVAWSATTRLFQRISGLLDPRIGRGPHGTFHARAPFCRWPLDHVFASSHFTLVDLQVLPAFGSDHLPVLVSFCHAPVHAPRHDPPEEADADERRVAREKIAEAREQPEG